MSGYFDLMFGKGFSHNVSSAPVRRQIGFHFLWGSYFIGAVTFPPLESLIVVAVQAMGVKFHSSHSTNWIT